MNKLSKMVLGFTISSLFAGVVFGAEHNVHDATNGVYVDAIYPIKSSTPAHNVILVAFTKANGVSGCHPDRYWIDHDDKSLYNLIMTFFLANQPVKTVYFDDSDKRFGDNNCKLVGINTSRALVHGN